MTVKAVRLVVTLVCFVFPVAAIIGSIQHHAPTTVHGHAMHAGHG